MVKTVLYVLGAVMVLVGLIGFVNDPVLGIFEVDFLHNIIHLITGAVLIMAASMGSKGSMAVKIIAITYALVAVIGLAIPGDMLLGLFEVNFADDILHIVFAILLIWLVFFAKEESAAHMGNTMNQPPMNDGGQQT